MNEKFIVDSIKMDLLRVFNNAVKIDTKFPNSIAKTFLNHALEDLNKIKEDKRRIYIKKELERVLSIADKIENNMSLRFKWAEDILTLRSMMH